MRAAIAIGLFVAASPVAGGQETTTAPGAAVVTLAFEVASVRANPSTESVALLHEVVSGRPIPGDEHDTAQTDRFGVRPAYR